jgi:hypothetical protein
VARASEIGVKLLDMSTECVEFLKRGCKEYKALEAIVKGWKAKAVEVVSGALPKKCTMCTSEVQATDTSGMDASIKVHLCYFPLALLLNSLGTFSVLLGTCLLLRRLCLPHSVGPASLGTFPAKAHLVGGALPAMCQSALAISVSISLFFTLWHVL